jgi:hypothetical protein
MLFTTLLSCKNVQPNKKTNRDFFVTHGIILDVNDLSTVDWPKLAKESGINTIGCHVTPSQVATFIESNKGKQFLKDCKKYGINVEYELHALSDLLPRDLFKEDSTMFRMNEEGKRVADYNLCVHSEKALNIICDNVVKYSKILKPTTGRYFYWIDDGVPMCYCPKCKNYSESEQSLILENRIIKALRSEVDNYASLAHLAYHRTLEAPVKIKPEDGVFLEFAPFHRKWDKPINELNVKRNDVEITHGDYLKYLDDNLKVFPKETAQVLEYWLDVSLFSNWKKPAVQLPWNKEVFMSDIDTYAKRGIRHITTFGVYMDNVYFNNYPDVSFLREYGGGLKQYALPKAKK